MKASDRVPPPRNIFLRYNYMIATHVAFDIIMNVLVALNVATIIFELATHQKAWHKEYTKPLTYLNYLFCAAFLLEAGIKVGFTIVGAINK